MEFQEQPESGTAGSTRSAPAPIWGRGGAQPFRPSQFLDRAAAGQGLRRGHRDRQAENALDQVAGMAAAAPKPNPRTTPS